MLLAQKRSIVRVVISVSYPIIKVISDLSHIVVISVAIIVVIMAVIIQVILLSIILYR